MTYFISLFIIFSMLFSMAYLTRQKMAFLFPLINLSVVAILYVFGLCKALFAGGILVACLALVLLTIAIILLIKKRDIAFIKKFFSPVVILLIVFSISQFFALYFMEPNWWDDLSHWGLVVKNMFFQRNFGGGELATTMFKGYPVGLSLYQYFFEMFGNRFCDGIMFMAINLFNISLLCPILSKFESTGKKFFAIVLLFACSFAVSYLFLFSILCDMFLSLTFAFILIMFFCGRKEDGSLSRLAMVNIALAGFVLTLAKSTGLVLSIFALAIIFANILFFKENRKTFLTKKNVIFLIALPILCVAFSKISWSLYLKSIDTITWEVSSLTAGNVFKLLIHPTKYQLKIVGRFLINLFWPKLYGGSQGTTPIPPVVFGIAFVIMLKAIYREKSSKERKFFLISIFTVMACWLVALLVLYIFTFTEREALTLSSFHRYVNTVNNGILLFLVSLFFDRKGIKWEIKINRLGLVSIFACVALTCVALSPLAKNFCRKLHGEFDDFKSYISTLEVDDRVYIMNCPVATKEKYAYRQNWTEDLHVQYVTHEYAQKVLYMRYLATPLHTSGMLVGGSPHTGDMWDYRMDIETTKQCIKNGNYNYLYIHNTCDAFLSSYQTAFEEEILPRSFYQIVVEGETMKFVKVDIEG